MCCDSNSKATKQVQRQSKTFVAYKVVRRRHHSSEIESVVGNMTWGPGIHKPHRKAKRYNSMNPHGFHFYFNRSAAQRCITLGWSTKDFVLPVRIDPKDVIAAEPQNPIRQGAALKVTVTEQDWKELISRIK